MLCVCEVVVVERVRWWRPTLTLADASDGELGRVLTSDTFLPIPSADRPVRLYPDQSQRWLGSLEVVMGIYPAAQPLKRDDDVCVHLLLVSPPPSFPPGFPG